MAFIRGLYQGEKQRGKCGNKEKNGAANGARTRDPQLGKLMLYQLSYCRINIICGRFLLFVGQNYKRMGNRQCI